MKDILLDSSLNFKLRSGGNEQLGNDSMELRLVLRMTIENWT